MGGVLLGKMNNLVLDRRSLERWNSDAWTFIYGLLRHTIYNPQINLNLMHLLHSILGTDFYGFCVRVPIEAHVIHARTLYHCLYSLFQSYGGLPEGSHLGIHIYMLDTVQSYFLREYTKNRLAGFAFLERFKILLCLDPKVIPGSVYRLFWFDSDWGKGMRNKTCDDFLCNYRNDKTYL